MQTSRVKTGVDSRHVESSANGHLSASKDANANKMHNASPSQRMEIGSHSLKHKPSKRDEENVTTDNELTQKQTMKILEEFLKKTLENKARTNGGYSKLKTASSNQPLNANRVHIDGRVKPTQQRLKQADDQRKLQDLVTGRYRSPRHQVSNVSIGSTDSADSTGFQRTKSFVKAQRHSIVTELESQANENRVENRRNSEDVPTEPLHPGASVTHSSSRPNNQTSSSIAHGRASSDPVMVQYATAERQHSPKKEGKEKKSWIHRFPFKKKREGHKIKSKDSSAVVETDTYGPPGIKVAKTPSDHRSETCSTHRRKTPSPLGSPKRTPTLFRRLSSKIKKGPSSSSLHTKSETFDVEEVALGPVHDNSKSSSLPKEVELSIHPHHTSSKKTHHRPVIDGSHQHRPNSLDLRKKKSKNFGKKIKNFFVDTSSSSSSPVSSSSEPDLSVPSYHMGTITDGASIPLGQPSRQNSKPTGSDSKPTVGNVRGQYHHSQSKSMSDMDSQAKNLNDIAAKLKSIADALQKTQYTGPTGRTQTPDSYHHAHRLKDDLSPSVNRSKSTSAKPSTMAMKAYINMEQARARGVESGHLGHDQRITRNDLSDNSLTSLDRHPHAQVTRNWSDRVENERRRSSLPVRSSETKKDGQTIPISNRSPRKSASRATAEVDSSKARNSHSPMPALLQSGSPTLRSSRQQHPRKSHVTTDGVSPHKQRYVSKTHVDEMVTTTSAAGTRTQITTMDSTYEVVQADAVPFVPGEDNLEHDFTEGFLDDDEQCETAQTVMFNDAELLVAESPLHPRPRAATLPAVPGYDELDNVEGEDETGAVGGEDPNQIDEEKLVDKLVKALCRKGDEFNKDMDLERTVTQAATKFTEEKFKEALQKAMSRAYDNVNNFRHPEVVELAVMMNMFSMFRRLMTQPTVNGFFTSMINHIVDKFGGWGGLQSSIDETDEEMRNLKDGRNSPHYHDKRGKDDGELD